MASWSSTSFLERTPYNPWDSICFKQAYEYEGVPFNAGESSRYLIGKDLPAKLARGLILGKYGLPQIARYGRVYWENMTPFEFTTDLFESIDKVVIEEHNVTDFYSIPRFLWRIYPPWGVGRKAAHVHDQLCLTKVISSEAAAAVFDQAMTVAGVPDLERRLKVLAVRYFGPSF